MACFLTLLWLGIVGFGIFWLIGWISFKIDCRRQEQPESTRSDTVSVRRHRPVRSVAASGRTSSNRTCVQRNTRQHYEERGWKSHGGELRGYYRTRRGSFAGRIEKPFSSSPKFFIIKPPAALINGPHGACFHEKRKGVFWVHFDRNPRNVNTGIMRIEHSLLEVL